MIRRGSISENDLVSFIIRKSKEVEDNNPYDAKAWLLTGKSVVNQNFALQYEAYLLEKRLRDVDRTAYCFDQLFKRFGPNIINETLELATAVRICSLNKGKETPDEQFMHDVFYALPRELQMQVLIKGSEHLPVLFDKCQCILLLLKLYPEQISSKNGTDVLFALLGCESDAAADAFSTFRKLLVEELVPSVLQLSVGLDTSPGLIALLDQCIEYYVLVVRLQNNENVTSNDERWEKIYGMMDTIGKILGWKISPFFMGVGQSSGAKYVESLYENLFSAFKRRNHYSAPELAYVTVVVFLRSVIMYYDLLNGCSNSNFGKKSQLVLVEVFTPRPHRTARPDRKLPIISTVSNCVSVAGSQSQVCSYFLTAVKIWDLIMSVKGDHLENKFFGILYSMKSLNLDQWNVFQQFMLDYRTYIAQHYPQDAILLPNSLKLASMYCSFNNYKLAAEYAIKCVNEALQKDLSPVSSSEIKSSTHFPILSGNKDDFSFYNPQIYATDKDDFNYCRRVHFISENRSEIIYYAVNILIRCFYEYIGVASNADLYIGHLITLLQLEWPSPPAEMIFTHILEIIHENRSFRYFPFFSDYIIEPDFLEEFMAIANFEKKTVQLELFSPNGAVASSSSRRMGTRGAEKGSKTEFKTAMQRQMMKNGRENLESLIVKFLSMNKVDLLACFEF